MNIHDCVCVKNRGKGITVVNEKVMSYFIDCVCFLKTSILQYSPRYVSITHVHLTTVRLKIH